MKATGSRKKIGVRIRKHLNNGMAEIRQASVREGKVANPCSVLRMFKSCDSVY